GSASFTGTGNAAANVITGGAGNDTLNGGAGADTLIGGTGGDILIGGADNDTYVVDDLADVVTEAANAGTDLVRTALSTYALSNIANVENLTYTGSGDFAGTGNALANIITGGTGNDILDGGAGADMLDGGIGNDTYIVDVVGDVVSEAAGAGTDEIRTALAAYSIATLANVENLTYTGSASFTGTGNAAANVITGGAGNDTLNGGAGADRLIGGIGNDTYIVDVAGDVVTEDADAGIDTVKAASAAYTLADNVENLTYTGTVAFAGTGNDLNNTITGGDAADRLSGGGGNDTLNGGAGADALIGGTGDDTYIVDVAGDVIVENVGEGIDTVKAASAAYTLADNVENLTYTGTVAFAGTGNDLNNTITGGDAADRLSGGAGNDTLDGGAGADTLIGGTGDDTYIVDLTTDMVTEAANEGTDTVKTGLGLLVLAANVENLVYTGTGDFSGIGNALSNTITGGAGNDVLNGNAGTDTLIGGAGNDIYIVDNAGDAIVENAGEGIDQVQTSLSNYTLGENIENLSSVGNGFEGFTGTGNELDNRIVGSFAASSTLTGGAGDDILSGGMAADFFVYAPNWGHDTIMNFEAVGAAHDTIKIDRTIFADWASLLAVSVLSGTDTIITADADNTITLKNVAVSSLQSADFQFV
ncbi:calcium-binding protein, partial [Rhizobium sp. BK251]|uniref:beta strand repeat-containing protein n=1 Tax=Rhizobium sp. BK251 TaxID=2512125 RepID=UPI00104EAC38